MVELFTDQIPMAIEQVSDSCSSKNVIIDVGNLRLLSLKTVDEEQELGELSEVL
jgi:hypothetical protein